MTCLCTHAIPYSSTISQPKRRLNHVNCPESRQKYFFIVKSIVFAAILMIPTRSQRFYTWSMLQILKVQERLAYDRMKWNARTARDTNVTIEGKKIIKYTRYQRNNRLQVNPKSAPETDVTIECKTLLARAGQQFRWHLKLAKKVASWRYWSLLGDD